jgi:hypothetical protein
MVNPSGDLPDFTRAILLMAKDPSDNLIPVLVDANGNIFALFKGETAGGALHNIRIDTDGQLVIVPRGATGNYLDVDTNGFLTAVLKGEYAGTLHTMAVDDAGRLQAFVLDSEDQWGDVLRVGNAELAARLGSPVTYDWRGQVLYLNTFERGYGAMRPAMSGTGASVSVVPELAMTGGYCVKLVGGSNVATYAQVKIYISGPPSGRIGGMARFAPDGTSKGFAILVTLVTDGFVYVGGVRINLDTDDIEYVSESPTYTKFADVSLYKIKQYWYGLKVVCDFTTKKYVRAMFGRTEWDLSAIDLVKGVAATEEYLTGACEVHSRSGYNDTVYVDQFVLTVGEPT